MSNLRLTKRFDDRVFQQPPSWTVAQGALSVSSAPFQSIANSFSQLTFQIQAPSQSVYLDRLVQWQSTVGVALTIDCVPPGVATTFIAPLVVAVPGRDFALCPSPLHSLVTALQATICDQTVTTNLTQNREIMDLLSDTPTDREWRTYPCALDTFANYNDAYGTLMNPLASFESATVNSMIGNGSWPITFTDPQGSPVTPYTDAAGNVVTFTAGGLPQINAEATGTSIHSVSVYFQFTSVEPLQLSPFIWRELFERKTGLSQLQNITVQTQMQSAAQARLIRSTTSGGRAVTSQALWAIGTTGTPFGNCQLTSQFLSPPLASELPLSPVNTVDYQSVVAFQYPASSVRTFGGSAQVVTQTLSLNTIPDWLIIAVQPTPAYMQSAGARTMGTWYLPIQSCNITWSNVTGLLSSQSQAQLFGICKANGIKMSWDQWRGYAQVSSAGKEGVAQLTAGPLVLRPGIDITLPPGQTPGQSNGQWTFSAIIQCDLSAIPASVLADPAWGVQTTVLTVNSGFLTTIAGTTKLTIGPLPGPGLGGQSMYALQDIPTSGALARPEITALYDSSRLVGGGSGGRRHRMRMSNREM